jgi:hypothetical protein
VAWVNADIKGPIAISLSELVGQNQGLLMICGALTRPCQRDVILTRPKQQWMIMANRRNRVNERAG